ncbi:2-amino-4-hydroxy-6-hydroxymethyldihydropteridine diphosphokinase [Capnocytophaga sp. H2931]|uniref:2-amino-4-hydroxy-6- hydroxymethyldihydropteridine diphosphokinase n=1 Tax=Capnocytophaga sp. H2931 TaxID=1945657 RepID=UPI000BB1B8CD|nr:2-amino-4-hydroxy-6-hydroxymethyldihydropteridine diphosphokinase [Capnocytophaga sp. H2931]ATA75007.1 2-amino-4-hydroxy-6-hydroxymethyldihydropteridine diphosphokinase [Capnocytophaga sp. H2931]
MMHEVYISLGSNIGDRKRFLQDAVNAINEKIGSVRNISSIYETPSWGFEGEAFFNVCLLLKTWLTPTEVLTELLNIERQLGRVRSSLKKGYQSRCIDLDILLFDDITLNTNELTIPHPQLPNRKFVLFPLAEIASEKKHPVIQKSIATLKDETSDTSDIQKITKKLISPRFNSPFANYNYIAIEGNIGAGKTTLATKIAEDFNAKLILERFSDNPFLPKFYENPKRYGFTLEMSFLTERYQAVSEKLMQLDLFKQFVVSDYDIFKSLIFSKVTLTEDEFILYRKLFYILHNQIIKPDLYVYLYQNTDRLIENIAKRGRSYEKNISADYLKRIQEEYLSFIQQSNMENTLIIDITCLDFVKNKEDYDYIIQKISNFSK